LILEVYQSEIDQREQKLRTKEVELYALQTQINPHFLFNVLNMIRGKLLVAGERDTAKVIGLLAKSFRMMLKNGGQMIRLAEELEFADSYLQIQRYRFGHKFTYSIDVPDQYGNVLLPKLTIQPLVENAITHAIELKSSQSRIWITGQAVSINDLADVTHLLLTVGDDGLGIAPGRLSEIKALLQEEALSKDSNIGLHNVHSRLKYTYGESYGLTLQSNLGEGTTVTILIPFHSDNGGDLNV
jgi:sensor histidine kinase YesM